MELSFELSPLLTDDRCYMTGFSKITLILCQEIWQNHTRLTEISLQVFVIMVYFKNDCMHSESLMILPLL